MLTAVAVLVVFALVGTGLLWVGQRRLVYFPSQVVPATLPSGVEEVTLATGDGLDLAAWFIPAQGVAVPTSVVVVFHGNGGNRVGRLPLARALASRDHAVLLVDYRGYGGNPGSPSATGLALDARAAQAWVAGRGDLAGVPVVHLGESLGAAVAIELALEDPPAAMVLRSPFTSLADVAREHYPVVPTVLLRDRWPSLARIDDLDVPILFVAGSDDEIVPVEQTRRLHDAARGPTRLVVVDGARHNDSALLDGPELVTAIDAFLSEHLPQR